MTLAEFLETWGYVAIIVGTFLEGETIVILGGLAAHLGHLELAGVMVAAFSGSLLGDQLWYYLGRHWGPRIIRRRLSWQESARKVYEHLRRHQNFLILTFRFYYGLRNVTPFVIGAAQISRVHYFLLNTAGAAVWAVTMSLLGLVLGRAAGLMLDDLADYEHVILGLLAIFGLCVWLTVLILHRRRATRA